MDGKRNRKRKAGAAKEMSGGQAKLTSLSRFVRKNLGQMNKGEGSTSDLQDISN